MSIGTLLFAVFAFLLGALPFSLWVGRYGMDVDIRDYGDGNPGVFNVLRAGGGWRWGGLAMLLDISKAAFPVGLAHYVLGITGLPMLIIAVAPSFGHAFSPFLGFKGGKAIASVGGMWIGLTIVEMPLVASILLVFWYTSITSSGWAIMFTQASLFAYVLLTNAPDLWIGAVLLTWALFIYKHRTELVHRPRFKMSPLLRPILRFVGMDKGINREMNNPQ